MDGNIQLPSELGSVMSMASTRELRQKLRMTSDDLCLSLSQPQQPEEYGSQALASFVPMTGTDAIVTTVANSRALVCGAMLPP